MEVFLVQKSNTNFEEEKTQWALKRCLSKSRLLPNDYVGFFYQYKHRSTNETAREKRILITQAKTNKGSIRVIPPELSLFANAMLQIKFWSSGPGPTG